MANARKRDDSVKPGCGIDGSKGENFTKQYANSPWSLPKTSDDISDGKGRYTDNKPGLRQAKYTAPNIDDSTYSIDSAVEANQPDDTNRAVKSRG